MIENEVIFELYQDGDYLKVSAIDTKTGIEVSVLGPARNGQVPLKKLALQKLERKLFPSKKIENQTKKKNYSTDFYI